MILFPVFTAIRNDKVQVMVRLTIPVGMSDGLFRLSSLLKSSDMSLPACPGGVGFYSDNVN